MMATSSTAFAPGGGGHSTRASFVVARKVAPTRAAAPTRLYMAEETLEEEVERLVQDEIAKTKKVSNLRNANGVEYAPWMKMTEEDEEKIRKTIKARTEARRARREEETDVSGSLSLDSQFQELSGTGLRSKVINGNDVELEWATDSEKSTKGFIVKRRPAKTEGFATIASYKSDPLLASKGVDGGVYRYIDEDIEIGGYVYRITECESNGNENDLSQCLVEIQTAGEQRGTVVAVVALAAVAVATVLAGALLDPVQY
jgi:hypothetical protein